MTHDYQQILVVLTAALGLSAIIERILQMLKKFFDAMFSRAEALEPPKPAQTQKVVEEVRERHKQGQKDALAEELASLQVKLKNDGKNLSAAQKAKIRKRIRELEKQNVNTDRAEVDEKFDESIAFVEPIKLGDRVRAQRAFWLQIIGAFSGVVVCSIAHLGILKKLAGDMISISAQMDYLLSGILIGAGSQPLRFLIEFLSKRKVTVLKKAPTSEEEMPEENVEVAQAPETIELPGPRVESTLIDIPYRGGVDKDLLEHVHHRPKDPDLIVYHHTAMHSDTTFLDVVRAIKEKGWSTGYHCVVVQDGTIHPYCRWDRYGNHVKGYNLTSLGIAFNGNFETKPGDEYSNADGRYGIKTPTEPQLHSAAKVVALWTFLYKIPPKFMKDIVPHQALRNTACPGSNFPHEQFKELIMYYIKKWKKSPEALQEIKAFNEKHYIHI